MSALLEVDRVSRRFGGLYALRDVSFSVAAGEIVGLIGPNGAGKTTCFNVVSGVLPPSSGAVRFKGRSIVGKKPSAVVAEGLVRTFQATTVFPAASVGLAPIMVQEIAKLIVDINEEQGLSIVLVEQNANLALRLCHHAYVLENGRVALSGSGKDLALSEYVQRAYLGV